MHRIREVDSLIGGQAGHQVFIAGDERRLFGLVRHARQSLGLAVLEAQPRQEFEAA